MVWWRVSRWQAFVAALLMALAFLTVWIGMNYNNTLTNYTVHAPGEAVTVDGVTYQYRGMVRSQVIQSNSGGSPHYAAPGMTWVAVVVDVSAEEASPFCPLGVTTSDQSMTWSTDESSLLQIDQRMSCFDIAEPNTSHSVIQVFAVPTSQVDRLGGVVINPGGWRNIAEVIR